MKVMFYKIFTVCLFMLFGSSNDENTISWSDNYKLTWDDFKGPHQLNTDAVAVTASGITFGYSVKTSNGKIVSYTSKIEAHFYPEKSWYIKEKGTKHILAHEQLHFDITELHARAFRARIDNLSISKDLRNQLDKEHLKINKELAEMQSLYDKETENSINVKAQKFWSEYIAKELQKLEAYKSK